MVKVLAWAYTEFELIEPEYYPGNVRTGKNRFRGDVYSILKPNFLPTSKMQSWVSLMKLRRNGEWPNHRRNVGTGLEDSLTSTLKSAK